MILVGNDSQGNIIHGVVTYVILVAYVVSTPFQSVLPPKGLSGGKPQFTSEAMKQILILKTCVDLIFFTKLEGFLYSF